MKQRVIYISGIGRSGSTLLDMILAAHPSVWSIGEVYKYRSLRAGSELCSCGKDFSHCPFWSHFFGDAGDIPVVNHMNPKDYAALLRYAFLPGQQTVHFTQHSDNQKLFQLVRAHLPVTVTTILDSSKEAGRLVEYADDPEVDLYNIHIVRDSRAVAHSFHSGTQGPKKNTVLTFLKWLLMNSVLFHIEQKKRIKTLIVSYEDLCRHPEEHLARLESFLGLSIPKNYAERIRSNSNYHCIGANRSAQVDARAKFQGIHYDERWKQGLSGPAKVVGWLLTGIWNFVWLKRGTLHSHS